MKSKKPNELARFNMPFELGLDIGIRELSRGNLKKKRCLIIDQEKYRYQVSLSDMGGSDIKSYGTINEVEKIIEQAREWFTVVLNPVQPSSSKSYLEYTEYISDLQTKIGRTKFQHERYSESHYFRIHSLQQRMGKKQATLIPSW